MEQTIVLTPTQLSMLINTSVRQAVASLSAPWVTIDQAIKLCGRGKSTIHKLIEDGQLVASHKGTKRNPIMIERKSIDKWHERNKYKPYNPVKTK